MDGANLSFPYTGGFLDNSTTGRDTTESHLVYIRASNDSEPGYMWPTSRTISDSPSSFLGLAVHVIRIYYTPLLVSIGTLANVITSVATMGSVLRKLSSSHYLCAICLANTLYLVMLFLKWLTMIGYNVYHRPIVCQLVDMLCNISSFLSIWMAVGLCVDRYISISWPPESPRMCTVIRSRVVITLMVVISLIIYLNTSLTVGVIDYPKGPQCVPLRMPFRKKPALGILEIIVNHAIPFTTISILLCLISRTIYKSRSGLNPLFQSDNSQLRFATLVYFTAFLLFQVPADTVNTMLFIKREFIKGSPLQDKWPLLLTQYLAHTGMAMNLVLLTASYPLFRQSLKHILSSWKKHLLNLKRSCCHQKHLEENSESVQLKEGCSEKGHSIEVCVPGSGIMC